MVGQKKSAIAQAEKATVVLLVEVKYDQYEYQTQPSFKRFLKATLALWKIYYVLTTQGNTLEEVRANLEKTVNAIPRSKPVFGTYRLTSNDLLRLEFLE